jgi:plastocyanin
MSTRMSKTHAAVATLVVGCLGLIAAGCGGGGSGGGGNDTVTIKAPAGGGTPTLTIDAHDIYFTPKQVKAPAGKLKIDYVEQGTQQHTLVIDGAKDFKLEVGPGSKNASGTVDLAPGEYSYYCTIPGHRAQGMSGTITVNS